MNSAGGMRTTQANADETLALLGFEKTTSTHLPFWQQFFVDNGLAVVVSMQALMALLIGLRVVPFTIALRDRTNDRMSTVLLTIFVMLSCVAVVLLRNARRSNHRSYRDLLHLAYHDSDTGLPNRTACEHILHAWLADHDAVSCMFLEVNGLCSSPGSFPHAAQTALTLSVVARLQPLIGPGDVIGYFTMDRYVLLLHGSHSAATLTSLADKVLEVMKPPHVLAGTPLMTTVNIGVATAPADAADCATLLTVAKSAMTGARNDERNTYRFAQDLRGRGVSPSNAVSNKLHRAILEDLLHLVYQPIYSRAGELVAVEALARWHDPEEGSISPGDFVPIAEATGLIVPLSNWVLQKACSQMVEWVALDSTIQRIAVNVSVKQVSRKDFIPTVRRTLNEVGLEAHRLELEVTEGAMASDFESVNRNLQELRQLGIRISIDDFGTGYSSLGRVRELNADVLKIDRVFVQGASESKGGAAVVQAIINMAHTLQLSVIAEGIETKEQMTILKDMACDEMQGFLLSRPQEADVITAIIRDTIATAFVALHTEASVHLLPRTA